MNNFQLRHIHLVGKTAANLFWGGTLKEQFQRLAQVIASFLDAVALAADVEFRAKRDEAIVFSLDYRSQVSLHGSLSANSLGWARLDTGDESLA